jgi:mannose-1-phosphate guanylyltransferase
MTSSAFILGAGFGTRLRPLTLKRPKPLMPVLGRPLIDYALATLRQAGIKHVMVNAHHLWEQMAVWAEKNDVELQVELPSILGTGGGLKAAQPNLNEQVIIWNGDILCDVSAVKILQSCPADGAIMALRHTANLGKTTPLLCNNTHVIRIGDICAMSGTPQARRGGAGLHFTGIHAMARKTLSLIPDGKQCVVRTAYAKLVPSAQVRVHIHSGYWLDIGNPHEYWQTTMAILTGSVPLPLNPWENTTEHPDSWVHTTAEVTGHISQSVIESHSVVTAETRLSKCIVWDNIEVPKGTYENCIFYDDGHIQL